MGRNSSKKRKGTSTQKNTIITKANETISNQNQKFTFEESYFNRIVNGNTITIKEDRIFINEKDVTAHGYKIEYIISNGANAVVIKATENLTLRDVAIKYWLPNYSKNKSNKTRSTEEIIKMSKLNNPNVISMYHFNSIDSTVYCIMEFVKGQTLAEYLKTGSFYGSRKLDIALKIISGLQYAHENNIYHGDLHLDNIMITSDDHIKLLDFGTSIFSGEYSKRRDSMLISESLIKLIGSEHIDVLNWFRKMPGDFSPECVTMAMKAYAKISTLLGFGLVDTVFIDIAVIAVTVPFFNLHNLEIKLQNQISKSGGDDKSHLIKIFRQTLVDELLSRVYSDNNFDKKYKESDLPMLYEKWHQAFITEYKSNYDIYYTGHDKETFNSELYSTSVLKTSPNRALPI